MTLSTELVITIIGQLLSVAVTLGVALYRLGHLEKRYDKFESWMEAHDKECIVRARQLGVLETKMDTLGIFTPPHGYRPKRGDE